MLYFRHLIYGRNKITQPQVQFELNMPQSAWPGYSEASIATVTFSHVFHELWTHQRLTHLKLRQK